MTLQAKKPRVLVVEDNEDVRRVVTVYLKANGFEVDEAADGLAGVLAFEKRAPDIMLFDVLLPKLDGIEALKKIREREGNGPRVPAVMMSAVLQIRDLRAETARLSVSAILQKPFQVRTLLKTITDVLEKGVQEEKRGGRSQPASASAPLSGPMELTTRLVNKRKQLPKVGKLAEMPVPFVMHSLYAEGRTGRLRVVSGTTEKRIYFQNGLPVYAESSIPEETLGAYLVERGRISRKQHAMAVKAMQESGRHFGEMLLKLEFLGPHELFAELESHLSEKVVSVFGWFDGLFKFEEDSTWVDDVIFARMQPGRIMLDGIQRFWSVDQISRFLDINPEDRVFVIDDSAYRGEQLGLSTHETKILSLCKRGNSVDEIVTTLRDKDLVYAVLVALFIMERVGFVHTYMKSGDFGFGESRSDGDGPGQPEKGQSDKSRALMGEYLKYRTADYFKLLGVTRDATTEEINAAFQTRQKRYHPDTLAGIDRGLVHEKIEELFIRVHNAYRTLLDPQARSKYLAKLEGGARGTLLSSRSKTGRQTIGTRDVNAETVFEDGFSLLKGGEFAKAQEAFSRAETMDPKVKYAAYRGWATYLTQPREFFGVEKELLLLFKNNGDEALIAYLLGNMYLREKRVADATRFFEKALEIDPQNIDSARQLRIIRMRQQTETSGLFDLFKKS